MRLILSAPFAAILALAAHSPAQPQDPKPDLRFSGYVDADFSGDLRNGSAVSGLEVDLTTTVTFNPRLNAVLYTTMTDGVVPAQGAGNTWAPVVFDGAALNWAYTDALTLHVGDLIHGTGYFNYYLHKRSAVVVGEHAVRGVGATWGNLIVATGVSGLGSRDSSGAPVPSREWSTFAKYDYPLGDGMTLTPSLKHTFVAGASPVSGGLSFVGAFGDYGLKADAAFNYWNGDLDPGYALLVEPSWASGRYSVSASVFYNEKGSNPAPNVPATTLPSPLADSLSALRLGGRAPFDDFFVYIEPGMALNKTFSIGLPLEYHIPSLDADVGNAFWAVPTLYIHPGAGVEWWIWGQGVFYANGGDPDIFAGSEIIFRF